MRAGGRERAMSGLAWFGEKSSAVQLQNPRFSKHEVTAERTAMGFCGYPLCEQKIESGDKEFLISLRERKVCRNDGMSQFCSRLCSVASKFYAGQLSIDPLYLRARDGRYNVEIVPLKSKGSSSSNDPQQVLADGTDQSPESWYINKLLKNLTISTPPGAASPPKLNIVEHELSNLSIDNSSSSTTKRPSKTQHTRIDGFKPAFVAAKADVAKPRAVKHEPPPAGDIPGSAPMARKGPEDTSTNNGHVSDMDADSDYDDADYQIISPPPLSLFAQLWMELDHIVTTKSIGLLNHIDETRCFPDDASKYVLVDQDDSLALRQRIFFGRIEKRLAALANAGILCNLDLRKEIYHLVTTFALDSKTAMMSDTNLEYLVAAFFVSIASLIPSTKNSLDTGIILEAANSASANGSLTLSEFEYLMRRLREPF
ncbi:hypothetical protein H4219_002310 [Mycoemilia scoparia]|uniref:RNA polymerase II subunit B1 CTD phosphatase RPAP2 homolog n=1 Tax=Mycoemilia scoparia TaxID=417184 RepID=A0A9W8A4G2_9FUNG|nr:hypothetical protein H4219_002310 [Mycoemilia scoparia]